MSFTDVIRIGKKIVSGIHNAFRIGQKVHGFFKGDSSGGRMGGKAQAQSPKAKSLSSEDFKVEAPPEPSTPPPRLQPLQRGLGTAGGGRKALQTIKAVKREAGLMDTLLQDKTEREKLKTLQRQKAKIKTEANAPSKRDFEKTAKEQRAIQQAQMVGKMSKKDFKKFQKKQEKLKRR